jgi:hypothetical protein
MSERGEIKRLNAKPQKNSGRGRIQKGDAVWRQTFVVDIKEASKSFSLNKDVWAKVTTDAMSVDRTMSPALNVILGEDHKVRLSIIETAVLENLLDRLGLDEV